MIVDTNIIIDILGVPSDHTSASIAVIARLATERQLLVNAIIFAEVSARFASVGDVEAGLSKLGLGLEPLSNAAAFRAGVAYRDYRRAGGPKESILPDFFIGAQAETLKVPILTRDPRRFATYFPSIRLIDPKGSLDA